MPGSAVPVLVPVPLDGPFDYLLADGPSPAPGTFVEVPFGGRQLIGVVWDQRSAKSLALDRLKPLGTVLDAPPMPATVRALIRHMAVETLAPQGAVLKLALSVPAALEPWPAKLAYRRAGRAGARAAEPAAPCRARSVARRHRTAGAGAGQSQQGRGRRAQGDGRCRAAGGRPAGRAAALAAA